VLRVSRASEDEAAADERAGETDDPTGPTADLALHSRKSGDKRPTRTQNQTAPARLGWLRYFPVPILVRGAEDEAPRSLDPPGAEATHPMISITTLAADKVKEISKSEGLEGQGLRLRVVGGGCAGFQYDLYFEDKPTDLDEQFESHGVKLFVDPLSYQYLDGTEIDYVDGAHGSGFKFGNPNVSGTCGCGSSFQA
jgi:iron-sulfur cluster insertion protein